MGNLGTFNLLLASKEGWEPSRGAELLTHGTGRYLRADTVSMEGHCQDHRELLRTRKRSTHLVTRIETLYVMVKEKTRGGEDWVFPSSGGRLGLFF